MGGFHFWNLEPVGKGIINVGNTLDRSCRSDKEKDGTHSSKRNTERPREKVNGQQAGRAKRTHVELQTRAAGRECKKNPNWATNKGSTQGGQKEPKLSSKGSSQELIFFKSKTRKRGRKGSQNGQRAGGEDISSLSFFFFPYISNGNNNSNNSTTNSIFELAAYNNTMDFFQFCDR